MDADRLPVIAAASQLTEREEPRDALALAERAAGDVLTAAPALARRVQRVSLVGVLCPTPPAPASELAARLGLRPARCESTTTGGNGPQWLVTRAAAEIAAGRIESTLIVGAEAMHTALRGALPRTWHGGAVGGATDELVGDPRPGLSQVETAAGLVLPAHVYPLFESVVAARAGRDPAEQRAFLGRVMAPFAEVAAKHPQAWFADALTADEIATPSPENRVVAEPYTKRMCAHLGVDQAAAVLVTTLAAARDAGLADRVVFVWSGADAADVWFPAARPDLGSSPGLRAAARAACGAAGVAVDGLAFLDVYSCFPVAVELAADALGIAPDDPRGLTVTGGLPYFGGPGNDYVTHAIATICDRLRERGGLGLVSGLGWYVTKHSVGIYGAVPPPNGFVLADTGAAQAAIDATALPVVGAAEPAAGSAVVEASTVVYGRDGAVTGAPVIARLADGRRAVAAAALSELAALAGRSLVGAAVQLADDPPTYRVERVAEEGR